MATLASITLSGETTLPLRMTRSAVIIVPSSQHGPTAVDRKIDAGDLALGVACQEQAGIGDINIVGHALERVVGGVVLDGLVEADAQLLRHVRADLVAKARTVDHAGGDTIDVDVVGALAPVAAAVLVSRRQTAVAARRARARIVAPRVWRGFWATFIC